MVDIRLQEIFTEPVTLDRLRGLPALKGMELLRKGSRLSVQPVTQQQFDTIVAMAQAATGSAKRSMARARSAEQETRRSVSSRPTVGRNKTTPARTRGAAR
jgi:hypothetical protein